MSSSLTPLLELDDAITEVAWDSNNTFYAALANGSIYHLVTDGTVLRHYVAHKGGVIRLKVSPDGQSFASAGEDGRVLLWNKLKQDATELANEPVWIEQLEWSASGNVLAAAAGKTIFLWRGTESIGVWYDARRHVQAMHWALDAEKLATATNKGVYTWRLGKQEPVELLAFPGAAVSVKWKPDGKALAVGTQDGFLQIWRQDEKQSARQLTMSGYPGKVNCLSWHPAIDRIATAGGNDIVIWDMSTPGKKQALPLSFHQNAVTVIGYSPDGKYLFSGDRNGHVAIWSNEGKQLNEFRVNTEVTSLAWNSDSDLLVAGDLDGRLHMFNS